MLNYILAVFILISGTILGTMSTPHSLIISFISGLFAGHLIVIELSKKK